MTTPSRGFVHLHLHTEHSALDGHSSLKAAVRKAIADGNPALAITDHGTMGGAWKFTELARKEPRRDASGYALDADGNPLPKDKEKSAPPAGLKPILGIEAYLALADDYKQEPDRFEPASVEVDRDDESSDADEDERGKTARKTTKTKAYQHITLLAASPEGYANLVSMVNESANSYNKKPLMDFKLIKEYGKDVIALTGCLGGPVLGPVAHGNMDEARTNLRRIIDAVGHDNVYVEVMEHGIDIETRALPLMAELAAEFELPLVATNDAHYVNPEDYTSHDAWLAIQTGSTLDTPGRFRFHGDGYHMRTEEEMRALRGEPWWQTAVSNTVVIADRVQEAFKDPGNMPMRLPVFEIPKEFASSRHYLIRLVNEGVRRIYGTSTPEIVERLRTELTVIESMGFIDYFLIVWDVIAWARSQGIRVGPGRGSAAGSLISYCLGIVQVDPLENNLLFERFLEPGRAGMPDIDVDFEQGRRGEVLAYLRDKYGASRVARIGSFSATMTRRALRDAAKLVGHTREGDQLSKATPIGEGGKPYTFAQLMNQKDPATARFHELLEQFGEAGQAVVEMASGIAGTVNGESIHACGTLISDVPMNDLIPLRRDRSKANSSGLDVVTQWDGKDVDAFGLLKLDVLGLRNLDVISKAVQFIKDTTGEDVDPDRLPHPNTRGDRRVQAAWELLQAGRTAGIFQMESSGMAALAQQVKPEKLGDLSAVVALYRPGPMSADMHYMYADRKNGLQAVDYSIFTDDKAEQDAIAEVLGETYGVFVYQEQLMRLATVIAGFDAKDRSKLRKAVGKKIKAEMDQVGEMLIEGAPNEVRDENGVLISPVFARATAARMFAYMQGSAEYLFNASHSFSYAQLAYVTAFLKANWPAQYGAAILATTDKADKRQAALRALREEGIEILAPDVNLSAGETRPLGDDKVLLGLSEIKGVSSSGEQIAVNREKYGPFTSLRQLLTRVIDEHGKPYLSVSDLEGLIEAGALDAWGPRKSMMQLARAAKAHDIPVGTADWGILERTTRQRARLGVIIGPHPMEVVDAEFWNRTLPTGTDTNRNRTGDKPVPLNAIPDVDGAFTFPTGVLAEWTERAYSKGRMVNFILESQDTAIRGVMWDETLKRLRNSPAGIPTVGSIVTASGRVQVKEIDVEDEEGKVIETVTTKELTVLSLRTPEHNLVNPPVVREPVRSGLRTFVFIDRSEDAVLAESEPAQETVDAEPAQEAPAAPVSTATSGASELPVLVWNLRKPLVAPVGVARDVPGLHRLMRNTKTKWLPRKPVAHEPGVRVLLNDGTPVALVYTGGTADGDEFPATWAFDGEIPSKDDLVFTVRPDLAPAPAVADSDAWYDELDFG